MLKLEVMEGALYNDYALWEEEDLGLLFFSV